MLRPYWLGLKIEFGALYGVIENIIGILDDFELLFSCGSLRRVLNSVWMCLSSETMVGQPNRLHVSVAGDTEDKVRIMIVEHDEPDQYSWQGSEKNLFMKCFKAIYMRGLEWWDNAMLWVNIVLRRRDKIPIKTYLSTQCMEERQEIGSVSVKKWTRRQGTNIPPMVRFLLEMYTVPVGKVSVKIFTYI